MALIGKIFLLAVASLAAAVPAESDLVLSITERSTGRILLEPARRDRAHLHVDMRLLKTDNTIDFRKAGLKIEASAGGVPVFVAIGKGTADLDYTNYEASNVCAWIMKEEFTSVEIPFCPKRRQATPVLWEEAAPETGCVPNDFFWVAVRVSAEDAAPRDSVTVSIAATLQDESDLLEKPAVLGTCKRFEQPARLHPPVGMLPTSPVRQYRAALGRYSSPASGFAEQSFLQTSFPVRAESEQIGIARVDIPPLASILDLVTKRPERRPASPAEAYVPLALARFLSPAVPPVNVERLPARVSVRFDFSHGGGVFAGLEETAAVEKVQPTFASFIWDMHRPDSDEFDVADLVRWQVNSDRLARVPVSVFLLLFPGAAPLKGDITVTLESRAGYELGYPLADEPHGDDPTSLGFGQKFLNLLRKAAIFVILCLIVAALILASYAFYLFLKDRRTFESALQGIPNFFSRRLRQTFDRLQGGGGPTVDDALLNHADSEFVELPRRHDVEFDAAEPADPQHSLHSEDDLPTHTVPKDPVSNGSDEDHARKAPPSPYSVTYETRDPPPQPKRMGNGPSFSHIADFT